MDKEKPMKYYSEKLEKLFDTPEALAEEEALLTECTCKDCDDNVNEIHTCKCSSKKDNKNVDSPSKKQLAAEVDTAENKLKEAYSDYDVAKKEVEELSKKYLEEVNKILEPARQKVKKAEKERYEAIRRFNDCFGAYQITLTGDRAAKEFRRALNEINSIHRNFFNNTFAVYFLSETLKNFLNVVLNH